MQFREIEAIDKDGNNVALNANGGVASQSSIYSNSRQPERGNDGVICMSNYYDPCGKRIVHTKRESGGRSDLI